MTNENDLISRADAIEAVAQQWLLEASAESPYVNDDDIDDYRKLASELLSDIPSAEAVQGEWIKTVNGNSWNTWWVFKCPNCGATIEDKQRRSWEYNFCPNCGAKMTKGGDNNEVD